MKISIHRKIELMNSEVVLIILTVNHWLYAGLAFLLPEMDCVMLEFSARHLPDNIRQAGKVIVVVDSLILFRGEWGSFNYLKSYRPDTRIFWLTRKETGRVFPFNSYGERVLNQHQNLISLRNAILVRSKKTEYTRYVRKANLTLTERILLLFLFSGVDMMVLSRITGKSVKTLYKHRLNIMVKTGFRQAVFLQFVYKQNRGLPCTPGILFYTEKYK